MSITGDFIRILSQAIDIAGDAFGTPKAALVRQGLDKTTAAAVVKIGTIYFGSTNAPRMQERARDAARAAGHTFRSLQAIESQVAKLEKKAYAWRLREELVPLGPDITRINAEGARLLQELNTHHADNPDKKLTYRSITNSTYATLTLTAESSRVKQIYDRARATDKTCPANGLIRLALAANDGELPPAATPCVLVPLDMSFTGFTEEGRGKFRFSLTNGATISGEEIVRTKLSDFLLAALVHPYAPQNFGVYSLTMTPDSRHADFLEWFNQALRNPVCPHPGCSTPATECDVHHIVAFKNGGKTVSENLMLLCTFFNGRNDDDPDKPMYGRMVRINGLEYWKPAFGGPLQLNMNPCAQGGAVRLVRKQLRLPIDPSPPG